MKSRRFGIIRAWGWMRWGYDFAMSQYWMEWASVTKRPRGKRFQHGMWSISEASCIKEEPYAENEYAPMLSPNFWSARRERRGHDMIEWSRCRKTFDILCDAMDASSHARHFSGYHAWPGKACRQGRPARVLGKCINASWSKYGGNERHIKYVKSGWFFFKQGKFLKVYGEIIIFAKQGENELKEGK